MLATFSISMIFTKLYTFFKNCQFYTIFFSVTTESNSLKLLKKPHQQEELCTVATCSDPTNFHEIKPLTSHYTSQFSQLLLTGIPQNVLESYITNRNVHIRDVPVQRFFLLSYLYCQFCLDYFLANTGQSSPNLYRQLHYQEELELYM